MAASSQHSPVCSLSTALNLQYQFKATKILDIYLVLNLFASHTLIGMFSKQDSSFSSYLFFRKYGERHPEITSTFNNIKNLKKKYMGVCLGYWFGLLEFVVLIFTLQGFAFVFFSAVM